jgi:hypothetical protein
MCNLEPILIRSSRNFKNKQKLDINYLKSLTLKNKRIFLKHTNKKKFSVRHSGAMPIIPAIGRLRQEDHKLEPA